MTSGQVAVSRAQLAWLTELGIDRKLLASIVDTTSLFPAPSEPGVAPSARAALKPSADLRSAPGSALASGQGGSAAGDSARGPAPEPASAMVTPVSVSPVRVSPPSRQTTSEAKPAAPVLPVVRQPLPDNLKALAESVAQCQACDLHTVRHQTVFGDGVAQAPDWMVIGEVPGDHDDHLGLPFQGKAGELLKSMLLAAGILPSATLFYTNLLKCRPKGARAPKPEEIEACLPFLRQQIALVRPAGLLVLGWQAAQALLNQRASLDRLRGQVHRYQDAGLDIPLVVTHHPASLMLRGHFKAAAWQDLHLARQALSPP